MTHAAAFQEHGGRLARARRSFPGAPSPWLDLSTGINPRAYPAPAPGRRDRARLPEPEDLARLEAVAARAFGVADPAGVAAAPGSELAIRLLPQILSFRRAAVLSPAYGSYAEALRGAAVPVPGLEAAPADADLLLLGRPNNPDGGCAPAEAVLGALGRRRFVVVDEAFADAAPAASLAPLTGAGAPGLLVLRSFGKFYGLAGVRLGFVVGAPQVLAPLRRLLGPWPVCADALSAGLAAYPDEVWAERTRSWLGRASTRLRARLEAAGVRIVGGTPLFTLAKVPDAAALAAQLSRAGVLVRPFSWGPTLIRFGLPPSQAGLDRLAAALEPAP